MSIEVSEVSSEYAHQQWPARAARIPMFRLLCPDPGLLQIWGPRWYDHPTVEKDRNGEPLYVCHPYALDLDAFEDFAKLSYAGWHVEVDGVSDYYPGRTVRVAIRPSRKETA